MRIKFILTLILLAFLPAVNMKAQDTKFDEISISKADEFQQRDGILLQKQFVQVGSMNVGGGGTIVLEKLSITNLISKEKLEALILSRPAKGMGWTTGPLEKKVTSIDEDEIAGLVKALNIIKDDILPNSPPEEYTEVIFTSRGGFRAFVFNDKNKWNFFIQLNKHDINSRISIDVNKIPVLLSLIRKSGLVK